MVFCLENVVVVDIVKLVYCVVNSMDQYIVIFIDSVCFWFKWMSEEFIEVLVMFGFFMKSFGYINIVLFNKQFDEKGCYVIYFCFSEFIYKVRK